MTRLSDALKRAAQETASMPLTTDPVPQAAWQFSAAETMDVPSPPSTTAPPPPAALAIGTDRHKLIISERVEPALVEQYRQLAAVLHHSQQSSGTRSVMVTSALPSEGKTLTATNLALTLSESYQRRVLLIDADLRRPRLHEMFALPGSTGLTDSLMTERGDRLPVHQVSPSLAVLGSGSSVPDPMGLLGSPAMKALLDDARESFEWVVVDTPPIAILPDANLLAAMIDAALLVVSAQSTPYPMVRRAAEAIGPGRILGVVLNRAEHAAVPGLGRYYSYQRQKPRRNGWLRRSRPAKG